MTPTHYVEPASWRAVVSLAVAGGCAAGALDPALRHAAWLFGLAAHAGTWAALLLLVPLSVALARWYPRRDVAIGANLLAAGTYVLSVTVAHGIVLRSWVFLAVALDVFTVMLLATPLYVLCALLTVLAVGERRVVGFDPRTRCRACGYLLIGLTEPRCPECGRPFEERLLGRTRVDAPANGR